MAFKRPGIREITSGDTTVTVVAPDGPVVDLSALHASGIAFNTEPQSGTFLDVETTGNDGFDGIKLQAADRIRLHSTGGDVVLGSDANDFDLSAGGQGSLISVGQLTLESASADVQVSGQTDIDIIAHTGKAGIQGETEADISAVAGDVKATAGGTGNIHLQRGTVATIAKLDMTAADIKIGTNAGTSFEATEAGGNRQLGFFGHAPAVQPSGVAATSAGIIAALQSLGIFA